MFTASLKEHSREAILFTLAELTDDHKIKVVADGDNIGIDTDAADTDIESRLFLNDLREQEEHTHRSVVDRMYIGMNPYGRCLK